MKKINKIIYMPLLMAHSYVANDKKKLYFLKLCKQSKISKPNAH